MSTDPRPTPVLESFPFDSLRLAPGIFTPALAANRDYLLALEPDRLLAPFLREAGRQPKAPPYGDWESGGLDGHTAGHTLSALATMVAATGDAALRERLETMVDELAACQEAGGDGYLGGIPRGRALWDEIRTGRIEAERFSLNGRWVPWYNLHKTLAGLRDAWSIARHEPAGPVLLRLADWCESLLGCLTEEQVQTMLQCEHGGMNEVLADLAEKTGRERYLRLARRFSHRALLDPLARGLDPLNGLHANTQIPKVCGFARIAAAGGDQVFGEAARFFWERVTRHRSVAFGGNSVAEHFHPTDDFSNLFTHREGPETCNTHNLLRLTSLLFHAAPDGEKADFFERALYNHILSSIDPARPGFVYFTPIRPGHYRVYSVPGRHFWCCVGSGLENPGRYSEFIFARDPARGDVYLNLFIAATARWPERGLVLEQSTAFPDEPRSTLTLRLAAPRRFTLHVRRPAWAREGFALHLNGRPLPVGRAPESVSRYLPIEREWRDGDRLDFDLPLHTRIEQLPDGSPHHAILHGPLLLAAITGHHDLVGVRPEAARMAHVASGPLTPLDQLPILVTDPEKLPSQLQAVPGAPLTFTYEGEARPAPPAGQLTLRPFFRVHEARYQIYWTLLPAEACEAHRAALAAAETTATARDAATCDRVRPGEQQPELEHNFSGEETTTGESAGRRFRRGGWFSYDLTAPADLPVDLLLSCRAEEGDRFDLLVNETLLATEDPASLRPGEVTEILRPIPPEVIHRAGGRYRVRFQAHPGAQTAALFDLRLLRRS